MSESTPHNANDTPRESDVDADDYGAIGKSGSVGSCVGSVGGSGAFDDVLGGATEPADPQRVDHDMRRGTRLAHESFDVSNLPKPLVECNCGECSDAVDPLAGESEVWRDSLSAREVCPNPRSVTVERAREAYLTYQRAAWNRDRWTSLFEWTRNQHGRLLGGERDVFQAFDDVTLLFLSLRIRPIEQTESGGRRWLPPLLLDQRLHGGWENAYATMQYQLRGFDFEWVRVTASTASAATPHLHVLVWVDDPADDVDVGMVASVVESFVANTPGAYAEDNPVVEGDRDAGIVFHDPPRAEISDEQALHVYRERDEEGFPLNTVPMMYVANQRPHWVLQNVYDGESDVDADSILVDGAAVAWASSHEWTGSSEGISLSPST